MTQSEKATAFRALHEGDPFVIPNPWDAGSARMFEALGFKALATTSSGFAFTLGRTDGGVTLDEVVDHAALLARATGLPVSVDLENGYGPAPEEAARAIVRAADAGAVGGSIEDWDAEARPVRARARGRAGGRGGRGGAGARLPVHADRARREPHPRQPDDLDDTIARLQAYERAGADVLYAPGLRNGDEIRAVCDAVSRPVNVLAHPGLSMREIAEAGGQRVSVGGALTWVAIAAAAAAATEIRDSGDFSSLGVRVPVDEWFA